MVRHGSGRLSFFTGYTVGTSQPAQGKPQPATTVSIDPQREVLERPVLEDT